MYGFFVDLVQIHCLGSNIHVLHFVEHLHINEGYENEEKRRLWRKMVKKVSLTVATLDPCLLNIDAEPTEVAEGPTTASLDIFPLKIWTKNKRFFCL